GAVEFEFAGESQRGLEIGLGLARKADDEVGGNADVRPCLAQAPGNGAVFQRGVAALHRRKHPVRARLDRQVHVRGKRGQGAMRVDQPLREFARVRGGVANAPDALNFIYKIEQFGKIRVRVLDPAAPGIHVLAEQRHLLHALRREPGDLRDHVVEGSRNFRATRVGYDAETAVFAAAFHDGDERRGALGARRGQAVEFLDLGKTHIHLRPAAGAALREQCGQAMQGLRSEYHVHERRALDDCAALLARDAAADRDHEIRIGLLEVLHASEVGEHLLLRLFAHRAGIEYDDLGFLRVRCRGEALGPGEHVGDLLRVVLVHLTAESADEDFAGHSLLLRIRLRFFLRRQDPDACYLALRVGQVLDAYAGGHGGGKHDHVAAIADLRAGRKQRSLAVDLDGHPLDVAHRGAFRIRGDRAELRQRSGGGEGENDGGKQDTQHGTSVPKRKWWRIRDSNPGQTDYDSAALTS